MSERPNEDDASRQPRPGDFDVPAEAEQAPAHGLGPGQGDPGEDSAEGDLLERFRLGDKAAFTAIVGRYQDSLVRFFFRLCWDRDRAEDFAQDVFLKLLRGARNYRPQGKLSTYLFKIATNRWIDYYRSLQPRPKLRSLDQPFFEDEDPLADRVPAEAGDPAAASEGDEERVELRRALHKLSLPHRLVFELAVHQSLPYSEIAAMLDIPEGTVKSRMHNSVKTLRRLIEEDRAARAAGFPGARVGRRKERRRRRHA
jgi:RNA polymerase sigma-70 factor (ECF subfamily)